MKKKREMDVALSKIDSLLENLDTNEETKEDNDRISINKGKLIKKIGIIIALSKEAEGIINELKLKKSNKYNVYPNILYINDDESVILLVNGLHPKKIPLVSTQFGCIAGYNMVNIIKPDIIINAGTCGGILYGCQHNTSLLKVNIGDVIMVDKCYYSDRFIPFEPWKGWDKGNYQLCGYKYICNKLGLKSGHLSTSNSFFHNDGEKEFYIKHDVIVKDMECCAIADICDIFDVKLIGIKGVTDIVGNPAGHEQFIENLKTTCDNITLYTVKTVNLIKGKNTNYLEC
mmetsp:Transcript_11635/g.14589  ORF Transcript_11635/g.14589 Transcript_11635/m.14589 type:complete len:287 (+) Transcript_11635:239-1099(+)